MSDCIFCKIITGQIPGKFLYIDENYVAFRDINPKAAVHILVCPRAHTDTFQSTPPATIAGLAVTIQKIATQLAIEDNYTLQINNGQHSGQLVFHLHAHLLSSSRAAAEKVANLLAT